MVFDVCLRRWQIAVIMKIKWRKYIVWSIYWYGSYYHFSFRCSAYMAYYNATYWFIIHHVPCHGSWTSLTKIEYDENYWYYSDDVICRLFNMLFFGLKCFTSNDLTLFCFGVTWWLCKIELQWPSSIILANCNTEIIQILM